MSYAHENQIKDCSIRVARGFWERLKGLLGEPSGRVEDGHHLFGSHRPLLIPNCRAIHTFGMRKPISVLFLSKPSYSAQGALAVTVIKVIPRLKPWRIAYCRQAWAVLEREPMAQVDLLKWMAQIQPVLSELLRHDPL